MAINWNPLREILETGSQFVLSSHVRPDADAIGSELALAALLEERGKSVRIVNPSDMPDGLRFLDPERRVLKIKQDIEPADVARADVHIVLDTSAWRQLQEVGDVLRQTEARKVVIDHHVSSDDLGAIEFKDPQAEATGALIVRMMESLGYEIPPAAVVPLFCAIATDTGWFRFAATTTDTLRIAGRLIDHGARPPLIYEQLYEQCSAARIRLSGRVLGRLTLECEGRLAYVTATQEDFKLTGARPADTEDLVNECLRIAGTQCAFIAVEQPNQTIKFSLRSRTDLDVSRIAEQFGGGGHRQASGATLPGPLESARLKVLDAMKEALKCGES